MTESKFHGVIPPVVIPLTAERTLDLEALERSINRMIDAGVDGLFFLGSSGEVAFLTDAQRYHVLQEAVAMVHGRVPVLAGIIDMETLRVVDQAKRATGYGVDGLVATAPFYALGGPKETERHFRAIREQTGICRCSLTICLSAFTRNSIPRCSFASAKTALSRALKTLRATT